MNYNKAFSTIEFIIFMTFFTVIVNYLLGNLETFSNLYTKINNYSQAHQIAKSRMEIILSNRELIGFENFTDPCNVLPTSTSVLCQINTPFNINSTIITDGLNHKIITVNVTGPDGINIAINYRAAFYEV